MTRRLLILDDGSNCLDMVLRAREAGWTVKWWSRTAPNGHGEFVGNGFIEKIQDFAEVQRKWIDWADLIYLPDNIKYVSILESYRLQGYPIMAPGIEAAAMEVDRNAGQRAMAEVGIPIMDSKDFHDYDSAIAYIKKHPNYLVSKPSGEADKALSYVAFDAADLIFMLQRWKTNPKYVKMAKTEGFILQERKYGVEMAVGSWFGPGGWSKYIYENWEYKKLMADDLGVNCFSSDTEVLTLSGWKTFDAVTLEDYVASYEPEDNSIFYEKPVKLHWCDYEGEMHHFKSRYVDLLVTPTHQMWATRRKRDKWMFYDAADMPNEFQIQHAGEFLGIDCGPFILPEFKDGRGYTHPAKEISMPLWATFMGIYLSEGSCVKYKVHIAQEPGDKKDTMSELIKDLPFPITTTGKHGITIHSIQLTNYLKSFGDSAHKYVPDYIRHNGPDIVNLFLDAYLLGDGDLHDGRRRWHTGSRKMVNDIQEMLTLHGSTGIVCTDKRTIMLDPINGKYYPANPVYSIEENTRKASSIRGGQHIIEHYRGKIGCVTLKTTHIIIVRRNERVILCGQTGEMGTLSRIVTKSKLAEQVLYPITPVLERLGYVGYIDNNCIIDEQGSWPMEWTMRDGWPSRHNITAHIKNEDPIQWMLDLVNGRDTIEAINGEVCVSVVMALPDFPYSRITAKELCGYPIRGADDHTRVHFSEVMLGMAPVMVGDKVVELPGPVTCGDYVLVVTGTGGTISAARRDAYGCVRKIKIPNSPFYRPDIGAGRMKKQLPILHKRGYAKGLEF